MRSFREKRLGFLGIRIQAARAPDAADWLEQAWSLH
jgi:hypothetical protein